jgi:hypothetical protein
VPWRALLIALVVLIALASPKLASSLASRRRWNRANSVPALAEAAWDDLRLGLSDLGVRWAASWTPRAVERRLLDEHALDPAKAAALNRLTQEIENARYAPPDDELGRTADERMADVASVISAVAGPLPSQVRWQARLWPQSGVATLTGLGSLANAATERFGRRASTLGTQVKDKVGKSDPGGPGGSGGSGGPGGSGGGPGPGGPAGGPDGGGSGGGWDGGGSGGRDGGGKEKVGSGQL